MVTPATVDLPLPKDWDVFEAMVYDIFSRRWGNEISHLEGRSGQEQKGVDCWGQPKEMNGGYLGVQCKRYKEGNLTLKVVNEEITKAENFQPRLTRYIIATTASRDARLQEKVRMLNENRVNDGKFEVDIMFWEDLSHELRNPNNEDLLIKYYPKMEVFRGQGRKISLNTAELILRCKKATHQERTAVVKKYIPEIYMPRVSIENDFRQFLVGEAVCFLIVAKAGRGKTNLICHMNDELEADNPVLFLPGLYLNLKDEQGILVHIAKRLDYPEDNWKACFQDMERAADSGTTPLILIDGINESPTPPSQMLAAIRELLIQARDYRVKVCITCRYDFWEFFRAADFWREFIWKGQDTSREPVRGEGIALFGEEIYTEVLEKYFQYFQINCQLVDEAWQECRNPLLLRFFCEAYQGRDVGTVSEFRLYPLFDQFWVQKLSNVNTNLGGAIGVAAISQFILVIADLMRRNHRTTITYQEVANALGTNLGELNAPGSIYTRILDEEIIIEKETNRFTHAANVFFVYDKFSEFAIAQSIYDAQSWYMKDIAQIVEDAKGLMREETEFKFGTLRGALEFLTWQLEDQRKADDIHFAVVNAMLDQDWKWRRIGSMLAPQFMRVESESFWHFIAQLAKDEREFVRRICTGQLLGLARRFPDRVVPLLFENFGDSNYSVRKAARETLLNLDAKAAIHFAGYVLNKQPLEKKIETLVGEVLLAPFDSLSPVLQEKARWLVKENTDEAVLRIVLDKFVQQAASYQDLFFLEEMERAFQVDWTRQQQPGNPYLDALQKELAPLREALEADLNRIQTVHETMHKMANFIVQTLGLPNSQANKVLFQELNELVEPGEYLSFWKQICDHFGFLPNLPDGSKKKINQMLANETPASLVVEKSLISPAFMGESYKVMTLPESIIWPFDLDVDALEIGQVADEILNKVAILAGRSRSTFDLRTPFGKDGLGLEADKVAQLFNDQMKEFGVDLTATARRSLTNPGRLLLWLYEVKAVKQGHDDEIDARSEELSTLKIEALTNRLSEYESKALPEPLQKELAIELQGLLHAFTDSNLKFLIEVLEPAIKWHSDHDSQTLAQAFDAFYWHEPGRSWTLANEMLQHKDQRVVDFASQLLEQMEVAEEGGMPAEIIDRVRAIIVSLLGVDPIQVTPESQFYEDLEADSLDCVEMIMSVEDEFGIEISDEDAERLTTVGELVQYLTSVT